MKVWANKLTCNYGGGLIIVAADSEHEAHETFHKHGQLRWMWSEEDGFDEETDYYYQRSTWWCLENVIANVDTPQVLAEDSYKG